MASADDDDELYHMCICSLNMSCLCCDMQSCTLNSMHVTSSVGAHVGIYLDSACVTRRIEHHRLLHLYP